MTSAEGSAQAGDQDSLKGGGLLWKGMSSMVIGFNLVSVPVATTISGSTTASGSRVGANFAPAKPSEVIDLSDNEGGEYAIASGPVDTMESNAGRDGDKWILGS